MSIRARQARIPRPQPSNAPLAGLLALVALACAACQQAWSLDYVLPTDAPSRAGLLAHEGGTIAGNEAGRLMRFGAEGEALWSVLLPCEIASRPVKVAQHLVAVSVQGEAIGVQLSDGAEVWRARLSGPVLTPLASDGSRVFAATTSGALHAFDPQTGASIWTRAPALPKPSTRAFPAPVLGGGVFVQSMGEAGIIAVSADNGDPLWAEQVPDALALLLRAGRVLVVTRSGRVLGFDGDTGRARFDVALGGRASGGADLVGTSVWVGLEDGSLVALAGESLGEVRWKTRLPAPWVTRLTRFDEALVLLPTADARGRLLGLDVRDGSVAFTIPTDSPLRTEPLLLDQRVTQLAADGRILAYRLKPRR
jgi:outer membrane protein assembly factor BamB